MEDCPECKHPEKRHLRSLGFCVGDDKGFCMCPPLRPRQVPIGVVLDEDGD